MASEQRHDLDVQGEEEVITQLGNWLCKSFATGIEVGYGEDWTRALCLPARLYQDPAQLAAVGKKRKRSTEEDAEFKKLQRKLDNSRRDMVDFDVRLLFKPPPQSKAQMEAIRKAKRTQEMVEKERTNQRVCMAGGDAASHWSPGGVRPQPYGTSSPLHPCPPIRNCWVAS